MAQSMLKLAMPSRSSVARIVGTRVSMTNASSSMSSPCASASGRSESRTEAASGSCRSAFLNRKTNVASSPSCCDSSPGRRTGAAASMPRYLLRFGSELCGSFSCGAMFCGTRGSSLCFDESPD